jgi:hypothetical protein
VSEAPTSKASKQEKTLKLGMRRKQTKAKKQKKMSSDYNTKRVKT